MLIRYLISNRLRVNLTSKHGFKYVTKRLFLFKRLFKTSRLIESLRRKGAQIAPFTIINLCAFEGKLSNLKIGKGSFIGNNSFIQLHANVTIGENVVINDSVKILTNTEIRHQCSLLWRPTLLDSRCYKKGFREQRLPLG